MDSDPNGGNSKHAGLGRLRDVRDLSRNMQERKELRLDPLLLVDRSIWGGCLKNRRIDESASHWQHLSANPGTCSQGYPQKMGNENIYASRFNAMGSLVST